MPDQQQPRGGRPIAASQRPTGGDKAAAIGKKQYFRRKKVCRFCVEKIDDINYKDVRTLQAFIAERARLCRGVFPASARRTSDV
jgi:small subunit ribosomal protein S18